MAQQFTSSEGIKYNITSPTTVEVIERDFFPNNDYSDDIVIPPTVTYEGNTYSVTSIERLAIFGCFGLTSLVVDSSNPSYSSLDNILYNKNKDILICCAGGKSGEVIIPSSVTSIGNGAFSWCNLASVKVLAKTPPSISDETFLGIDKSILVYAPKGSIEAYKSAPYWSEFTNYTDAKEVYLFVSWNDGDTNAIRTITVTKDTSLTANFIQKVSLDNTQELSKTITLYPNPATNEVNINVECLKDNAKLSITDIQGRILKTQTISSKETKIDVSSFAKGVYFIRIENSVKKLIVE